MATVLRDPKDGPVVIAALGFWDARGLVMEGIWLVDGKSLPFSIEFYSRISEAFSPDGRPIKMVNPCFFLKRMFVKKTAVAAWLPVFFAHGIMIDVVDTEGKGFSWTVFTAHAAPPPKRPGMPVFFLHCSERRWWLATPKRWRFEMGQ